MSSIQNRSIFRRLGSVAVALVVAIAIAFWWIADDESRTAKKSRVAAKPDAAVAAKAVANAASLAAPEKLSFNEHVRPILSTNCYHCHGQDAHSRKADLRLDREEFAFAPRKDGPVIVRGQPDKSPLVLRVESSNPSEIMPSPESHKVLEKEEIAVLRRWVQEGAEYEDHWAFIAPKRPAAPAVARSDWARNDLDRFVLARLEKEKLPPAPEADKFTLIRRATYDATGLPPTPEEIAEFTNDMRPDAWERLIDRLVASPRYGEHRARYWLDAARYGDTHGQQFDNFRLSWPYRDYVIDAFNRNKPFDRFGIEQIAGDLLPTKTFEALVATGFNRAHVTTNEDGSIPEELQFHIVSDRVQTVATAFLGLTAACATCHDHKFDPITQKDFYQLSAFFNNTMDRQFDGNEASPAPTIALPPPEKKAEAEEILTTLSGVEDKLAARRRSADLLVQDWIAAGGAEALRPVSSEGLLARLKFDEGSGTKLRNSAPGASPAEFETAGQPIVWGEHAHFWPIARFGGGTRLQADKLGDFEASDAFTASGWVKLREARLGHNGPVFSRMGHEPNAPGWELFWEDSGTQRLLHQREGRLVANLVGAEKDRKISVRAKRVVGRREWLHVAFTYDGSGAAAGVRIYINGQPQSDVEVLKDNLVGSIRTPAPFALAQPASKISKHTTSNSLSETAFQDVRLYARALAPEELRRSMHEEVAHEILQRPRAEWNADESNCVAEFFLRNVDRETLALREEEKRLQGQLAALTKGGVKALVTAEREERPMAHVFYRGLYTERRERVQPDVPDFLPPLPDGARRDRLSLAQWLFGAEQPLTARVTVNRMWQELFGAGLVESTGDFGVVGATPSHPQLLDWLAVDFQESGWDVKRFYKQVLMSATYRQSAHISPGLLERDPQNRLLARGPRFRLDAEAVRDGALAASGLLAEKIGGPSVNTYQPPGIWEPASRKESNTFTHKSDTGNALYRRSIYTFWKRTSSPPVLATFDAPMRDVCTVTRERTNTPLQALVSLNATVFVEAARHIAQRALSLGDTSQDQRTDFIAQLVLSRPASPEVREVVAQSLEAFRLDFSEEERAKSLLAVGESPVDATLPSDELAAWTMAASLVMNTDAALNK